MCVCVCVCVCPDQSFSSLQRGSLMAAARPRAPASPSSLKFRASFLITEGWETRAALSAEKASAPITQQDSLITHTHTHTHTHRETHTHTHTHSLRKLSVTHINTYTHTQS